MKKTPCCLRTGEMFWMWQSAIRILSKSVSLMANGHQEGYEKKLEINIGKIENECPSRVWVEVVNDQVGDRNSNWRNWWKEGVRYWTQCVVLEFVEYWWRYKQKCVIAFIHFHINSIWEEFLAWKFWEKRLQIERIGWRVEEGIWYHGKRRILHGRGLVQLQLVFKSWEWLKIEWLSKSHKKWIMKRRRGAMKETNQWKVLYGIIDEYESWIFCSASR